LGSIVILGIQPDRPETGYGYIRAPRHCEELSDAAIQSLTVQAFVEKPNQPTAEGYMQEGGYYWNAGMFVLKASVWLKALGQFCPDIVKATLKNFFVQTSNGQLKYDTVNLVTNVATYQLIRLQDRSADRDTAPR
jgi:mannose-1-phosphate guanylyltransferase